MTKKTFKQVFESYFHRKYSFEDFINYIPLENINYKTNRFQSYTFVSYLKDKSGKLLKESKKLKDYHSFLNILIFKKLNVHEFVYSYVDNKNVFDMVYLHKDNKSFYKTDIKNFFGSIDRDIVSKTIKDNLNTLNIEIDKKYIDGILNLILIDNILPVGFITSPSVSNSVLYNFDKYIYNVMESKEILYTRYSDDLVFSTENFKKLINVEKIIEEYFEINLNNKFILNNIKSKFMDKTRRIQILGLIITPNGHITVEKEKKESIQKLIYFYKNDKDKFLNLLNNKFEGSISKAYGNLNYINDIDKNFILKLRKKYGNFIVDKFLHGKKS